MWRLLGDKTAIAATGLALIKRPPLLKLLLRLAGLDKTAALIKRPLRLALIKRPIALADKLLVRGNMKSAIRSPNLTDLAIWPLHKTAIAGTGLALDLDKAAIVDKLDKTAIGFDKTGKWLAGLDKIAIRFASPS